MNILEGKLVGSQELHIAIVASRFNEFITSKLLSGAGGKKALRSTYVFGLPAAVLWMTYVISNTVLIIAGRGYATEMPYVIQLAMLCLSVHSLCLLFTVSGQRASAKAESNLEENALKGTGNA